MQATWTRNARTTNNDEAFIWRTTSSAASTFRATRWLTRVRRLPQVLARWRTSPKRRRCNVIAWRSCHRNAPGVYRGVAAQLPSVPRRRVCKPFDSDVMIPLPLRRFVHMEPRHIDRSRDLSRRSQHRSRGSDELHSRVWYQRGRSLGQRRAKSR